MKVTILLFASVAAAVGKRRIEMSTGEGARVGDIRDALAREYPALERYLPNLLFALDEEYVETSTPVPPGATLALIPPVSGGAGNFVVTADVLDPAAAIALVADPGAGAIDVFLGVVRNANLGRSVDYLEYEAYEGMAERVMEQVVQEAKERFGLLHCAIFHRTGRLEIGETSLVVAMSSAHRAASFEGGKWLVDEIKKRVPVWKKEVWSDGEEWIEGPESLGMTGAPAMRQDR